mgnify:CR=1 FL=1|jgi:hypothetical protein
MHIPLATTNYEDLIDNALWIVVDAWAQQPDIDDAEIDLNIYNKVFLGHLKEELRKTHVYKDDKIVQLKCKNVINFMQSEEGEIDPRFKEFLHINNQEDLIKYIADNGKKNLVICGLHYGKCITTTATILLDAIKIHKEDQEPLLPGRRLFIKRDMCCLWPNDEISMHDRVYKQMDLELI